MRNGTLARTARRSSSVAASSTGEGRQTTLRCSPDAPLCKGSKVNGTAPHSPGARPSTGRSVHISTRMPCDLACSYDANESNVALKRTSRNASGRAGRMTKGAVSPRAGEKVSCMSEDLRAGPARPANGQGEGVYCATIVGGLYPTRNSKERSWSKGGKQRPVEAGQNAGLSHWTASNRATRRGLEATHRIAFDRHCKLLIANAAWAGLTSRQDAGLRGGRGDV